MITNQKHIIHKVHLEIYTHRKKTAYKIKDTINVFLQQDVFPYLERYFELMERQLPSEIMQIQKLHLEVTVAGGDDYHVFAKQIGKQVSKEIRQLADTAPAKKEEVSYISIKESNVKSLLFFLEKGLMPWWNSTNANNIFDKEKLVEIVNTTGFSFQFRQCVQKAAVQKRLINQFSNKTIQLLLKHAWLQSDIANIILSDIIIAKIQFLATDIRQQVWAAIISCLITNNVLQLKKELYQIMESAQQQQLLKSITTLVFILEEIQIAFSDTEVKVQHPTSNIQHPTLIHKANKQEREKDLKYLGKAAEKGIKIPETTKHRKEEKKDEETSYYIENAGLILLHPFLKQFFKNCQLLGCENTFTDVALAIHLLHYIATKKEEQYENTMAFEKFLCGVPIQQSIQREKPISKELKKQVDKLLGAVLHNWKVLQNSSHDLLRYEFLQRQGKLCLDDEHPKLIVERKTQDILLDKIPWNIALCKLPWRKKIIFTDWY